MAWKSSLPALTKRLAKATDAGLIAMAAVPMAKTQKDLEDGFTSGRYTDGTSAKAVKRGEPHDHDGGRSIQYGSDVMYNLWWTIGFHNPFTRQFERRDEWTTHLFESRVEMATAFRKAFKETAKL